MRSGCTWIAHPAIDFYTSSSKDCISNCLYETINNLAIPIVEYSESNKIIEIIKIDEIFKPKHSGCTLFECFLK